MKKYSQLTVKEMSDSGQALALVFLVLALIFGGRILLWLAAATLVCNMASPRLFRWFAFLWLNFSHGMGIIVSHIILGLQFYLLVLPVGLIRRVLGKDAMALKKWRKGNASVFVERNHLFTAKDLRNPY